MVVPIYIETPKLITSTGIVKVDNKYYMEFELDEDQDNNGFYQFISKEDWL